MSEYYSILFVNIPQKPIWWAFLFWWLNFTTWGLSLWDPISTLKIKALISVEAPSNSNLGLQRKTTPEISQTMVFPSLRQLTVLWQRNCNLGLSGVASVTHHKSVLTFASSKSLDFFFLLLPGTSCHLSLLNVVHFCVQFLVN